MRRTDSPAGKPSSLTRGFLWILVLSTAVRLLLSVFNKTAVTYNDELFYLELAQNLFRRGSLTVYGTQISFTKLLYPLLLSPFYAVTDGVLRTRLISGFNALLVSSALVPGFLLARRILKKNRQVLVSVLLLACSPNLLFSMTFMAENLYYPLLLWAFLAAYSFFCSEQKNPSRALLLGFLAFLLYFTKEVGAAWAAALFAVLLAGLRNKKSSRRETLLSLGCFVHGMLVPWLLLRLTLARGLGYSYASQVSFSVLSDASHILFFFYAAFMMLLFFLVASGWYPVALPVLLRKKLSPEKRSLLLLSALYALIVAAGIAFGISMGMDYAHADLQIHLRYFLGSAFPFLLLCFSLADEIGPVPPRSPAVVSTAVFAVFLLLFLTVPKYGSLVAFPVLHYTHLVPRGSDLWRWVFRGIQVLLLAPPLFLWIRKRKRAAACFLLSLLLVAECFSGAVFAVNAVREEKADDPEALAEINRLDRLLDTLEGNTLVLAPSPSDSRLKLMNTVLDDDYAFATFTTLKALADAREDPSQSWIDLSLQPIPDPLAAFSGRENYGLAAVDQIVVVGETELLDPYRYEDVTPEGAASFRVFRAKDASRIALYDPLYCVPGTTLLFHGTYPSFRKYQPAGFSVTEENFTWSADTEVSLTLRPAVYEPLDLTFTWTWNRTLGEQSCTIYANDTYICSDYLDGSVSEMSFVVPAEAYAETGYLTLRFLFPDAREPGTGDPRLLAVAFESLTLEME